MNTAKIIAMTQPSIISRASLTAEEFVAYVARVSNPTNQLNTETAPKLLKYLMKNKHWSPFEMVDIVMLVETTRDIARQILRHRSFSFQEFSQRYADPTEVLGFVTRESRLQDTKNRQNSIQSDDETLNNQWSAMQNVVKIATLDAYKWATDNGIAKEQARAVLPEGLTVSRMYMKGSLRSWIHYLEVRLDDSTQKEHREVAQSALEELQKEFKFLNDFRA
jgi:thymidylate synthase (FAD)